MSRLFILLLCLSLGASALADTRCALVIGNGAYPAKAPGKNDLGPLSNPANDANDMAKLLQDNGVVLVDNEGKNRPLINANKQQMDDAVDAFIAKLPGCSAALFYYSGHGVYLKDINRPLESANYLLPVGERFRAAEPANIKYHAVNAHAIKDRIQNSGVKTKLMILDACRDRLVLEESKGFGGGEEFRPMGAVQGMMVVYATLHSYSSFGDATRRNSVFTEHLLAVLKQGAQQNITNDAISAAIAGVEEANRGLSEEAQQHPWPEGLLSSAFCLQDCGGGGGPQNQLTLAANVTGAKVYIGGTYYGETPVTVNAGLGSYNVRLEKPGYETLEERVEHSGTQTVKLYLHGKGQSSPPPFETTYGETGQERNVITPPSSAYTDPSTGMAFVRIPGGCFQMGSPDGEKNRDSDEKQHRVCVEDFWMGKTEVTQAQWQKIMGNNPAHFKGDNKPVEQVSWNDAQDFLGKLSAQGGKAYRLPTEAEWEYSARAGSTTPFYTGECISTHQANYDGNYPYQSCPKGEYRQGTVAVGSLNSPNAFGLHDMHGNVWEWTCSAYEENYSGGESLCNNDASLYVLRGGSWYYGAHSLRAAAHLRYTPGLRSNYVGFRVVFQ